MRRHCEECGIWRRGCEFFRYSTGRSPGRRCLTCRQLAERAADSRRRRCSLPAEPIQQLIRETGQAQAARIMEVSPRRIYAIMRQERVQLDTADRWCIRFGLHLNEVYP
jgi:hypothetical protein